MTREAVIHIGMHKTGTSSIQQTFKGYADDERVYLPSADPNHSSLTALAFRNKPQERFYEGETLETGRARARRVLDEALSRDRRSVVISAEELSTLPTDGEVQAVLDFLGRHVDRVRVLAYVRDPVSFAPSLFQQILHRRLPSDDVASFLPPYRKRFKKWRIAVRRTNIEFVPFDPARFHEGDLLVDFARRTGLSTDFARRNAVRTNESWSAEAVALIYALRRRLTDVPDGGAKDRLFRALHSELKSFGQGRFAFSRTALAKGLRGNKGQIAWMERILEAPLPEARLDGRMCFDTLDALAAHAETLGAALAAHPAVSRFGLSSQVAQDPVGALEQAARRVL